MAPKRINVFTPQKAKRVLKAMGVPSSALGEAKAQHQKSERITPIKLKKGEDVGSGGPKVHIGQLHKVQ